MLRLEKYHIILVITIFALLSSCTEVIEIDLDSTYRRLVANGSVTNDSVRHQIHLSTSSDYFSNQPSPKVSGALVEIQFNTTLIQLQEHDTMPGMYLTPDAFRGIPNTTYHLRISGVDINEDGVMEEYQAQSSMPDGMKPDSILLGYFKSPFVSGYQVFMYGQDPPTREWYGFKMWKNSDLLTDTLSKYSVQNDDFFNGTYIYGLPVGFLYEGDPREALQAGDTVTFELNSIEQVYYDFVLDAQLEIIGNNPLFSGPPANVRSNIDNEARGLFAAYTVHRVSAILPP